MSNNPLDASACLFVEAEFVVVVSARWKAFAFCGIFPDTYRAAPPRPGLSAGNLFAMTVVERGIEYVSSSYSVWLG